MNNLLAFADNSDLMTWIIVAALICLAVALVIISTHSKKLNTQTIVLAGICIASSFTLSFIKIPIGLFGGSITLASFVPIIIFSFVAGVGPGLLSGAVFGLLNFISDPWLLTPWTFILDYILAFMSIGCAGFFGKMKNKNVGIILAVIVVYVVRFTFATISGLIYFDAGIIVEGISTKSAFIYSFLYQCIYLLPDFAICLIAFVLMATTKSLTKILSSIKLNQPKSNVISNSSNEPPTIEN